MAEGLFETPQKQRLLNSQVIVDGVEIGSPIELPTEYGRFTARYVRFDGQEGVALRPILEKPKDDRRNFYLRIQSSCLFSESFHAQDCDCALQLQASMKIIARNDGLLIYLYQEGRGIGLKAKMEAIYIQQSTGADTKAAFAALGYSEDRRLDFQGVQILVRELVGLDRAMTLLTNNPQREQLLRSSGIKIGRTQTLKCGTDSLSRRLSMAEKQEVLGHNIFTSEELLQVLSERETLHGSEASKCGTE